MCLAYRQAIRQHRFYEIRNEFSPLHACTLYWDQRACMARSLPVQIVTACGLYVGWCLGTVCVCAAYVLQASVGLHGPTRSDQQLQY